MMLIIEANTDELQLTNKTTLAHRYDEPVSGTLFVQLTYANALIFIQY